MATSPLSTRRYGGNALAATLATTLAVTTPALASDPQVHREGDDACAIAFMPQGKATVTLTLLRSGAGVDFLVAAGGPGDARFDLLANGANFELFFRPVGDGRYLFHLAGDEPFLPALVSGTLVPFGPTRWEPPVTAFRLAGGHVAYAALRQCAASLAARAAPITPAPTPPSPQARPYTTRPPTRDSLLAGSPTRTAQPGVVEIALQREHSGTFVLMATVNGPEGGGVTAPFMLDTGASDVSLPQALAERLMVEGTLSERDFVRVATYRMADGRTHHEPVYRLRSISVGPLVVHDIECSISQYGTMPLLGQSFLKRFRSVMLDQARSVLVLTP
jgi:clan AA aspartic protease (TIGR02281 family)